MSWAGLAAAVIVAVLLQTTVCQMGELPLVDVDLLLILALIYGLLAPVQHARIAGWIIGFAYDLTSEGPLGIYALALGLTALLLTLMREVVNRHVWHVRLLICFMAALPGQLLVPLHLRFVQGGHVGSGWQVVFSAVMLSVTAAALAALITGLPPLAPRKRAPRRSWTGG